eukprot:COSAG05_NODE_13163_length_439_cov_1.497059_2_plen_33_part_01
MPGCEANTSTDEAGAPPMLELPGEAENNKDGAK